VAISANKFQKFTIVKPLLRCAQSVLIPFIALFTP